MNHDPAVLQEPDSRPCAIAQAQLAQHGVIRPCAMLAPLLMLHPPAYADVAVISMDMYNDGSKVIDDNYDGEFTRGDSKYLQTTGPIGRVSVIQVLACACVRAQVSHPLLIS